MNSVGDFFINWSSVVYEKYNVNPTIFIVIYCASVIPAWVVVALVAKKLFDIKNGGNNHNLKKQIYRLLALEAFILLLPYAYIAAFAGVSPAVKVFGVVFLGVIGLFLVRKKAAQL